MFGCSHISSVEIYFMSLQQFILTYCPSLSVCVQRPPHMSAHRKSREREYNIYILLTFSEVAHIVLTCDITHWLSPHVSSCVNTSSCCSGSARHVWWKEHFFVSCRKRKRCCRSQLEQHRRCSDLTASTETSTSHCGLYRWHTHTHTYMSLYSCEGPDLGALCEDHHFHYS